MTLNVYGSAAGDGPAERLLTVQGLPVRPQPLWLTDFRQRISVSLWFVPTIFALLAIGIANLCVWLDGRIGASVG